MAQKTKNGKRFVKAAGVILLTVATILGSVGLTAHNKAGRISEESQVETIAEALDCDLSYMKYNSTGGVVRMMHNGDEPIYVHITDEMNEEETGLIKESLDYVFGIVGSINDKYKYEIVDNAEYYKQRILGKTTIKYVEGPCDTGAVDSTGQIFRFEDIEEKFSKNDYYNNYFIEYDREESKDKNLDQKLYTFLHELLHAFGLDDVYLTGPNKKTDINYYNTFMKGYSEGGNIITPNDLKCLFSAYKEQLSDDELAEFIEKAEEVSKRYEAYYYENRVEKIRNYENNNIEDLKGENINSAFEMKLVDVDQSVTEQKIQLKIVGDEYILEISGAGREEPCVATGSVIDLNGVKVLKNVKITGAFDLAEAENSKFSILDLYLVRQGDKDLLYDANTYSSMWGKNLENIQEKI